MLKQAIRRLYHQKRISLTRPEVAIAQDLLLIQCQRAGFPPIHLLHHYLADVKRNEPDPLNIVRWLSFLNPGLQQTIPRIDPAGNGMEAIGYDDGDPLIENAFGILEPAYGAPVAPHELDLVLVPLLAFDRKLHRVGYGKGYYDRFLKRCRPDCLKIGLSYFAPVDEITDIHPADIPLDICITPEGIHQ